MNRNTTSWLIGSLCALMLAAGCTTAPKTEEGKEKIEDQAARAVARAEAADSGMTNLLNSSAGYAVFPTITKGAAGVGGAYGKGVLYENGQAVGYCDMTQATVGAQLGGQDYTEVVVFKTPEALQNFKKGQFKFDAQASAVALKHGSSENAKFTNGVAVFTFNEKGLMAEASVGGQKFDYQPK
jgi:lipid-binding SYLF domain-containing protein